MEPVNILLVDNSRDLDTLDSILARPDYHVFRAPTANEALLALANHDFAVIVLDIDMPVADRFKIAGLSKNRKGTRHIPVIFLMAVMKMTTSRSVMAPALWIISASRSIRSCSVPRSRSLSSCTAKLTN